MYTSDSKWIVRDAENFAVYEGEDHPFTVATEDGRLIARIALQGGKQKENASLIAAAPELYAALDAIVNAWLSPLEKRALTVSHCEEARRALSKARS